ncbi:unnamed protein product [Mycena citricolor]|uniref:F-box domain-containing protein n=1 Tax=Mycena citricolor TaxID=2018698 RepID=A0AAD2H645_9AGAR|nr:unnamed protein product [Mycena citricolor]
METPTHARFPPSPFADKLYTNYCPSTEEVHAIQTYLVEPRRAAAALDTEIAAAQAILDALKARRSHVGHCIDAHEALVAAVRQVPPEILQTIFVACLPERPRVDPASAPLVFTRVCRYWREVARGTPELWSNVEIPRVDALPSALRERFEGAVASWLDCNRTRPVSISFSGAGDSAAKGGAHPNPAFCVQQLHKTAPRLRNLEITGNDVLAEAAFDLAPAQVPLLESFVARTSPSAQNLHLRDLPILSHPNLNRVWLEAAVNPRHLALPWAHLQELSLTCTHDWRSALCLTQNDVVEILSQCPKLVRCLLAITAPADSLLVNQDQPAIHLPLLEELVMPVHKPVQVEDIQLVSLVKMLDAPALRRLCFARKGDETAKEFVHPAPEAAKTLCVAPRELGAETLVDLVKALPRVTALRLVRSPIPMFEELDDGFLAALPMLCPKLESLDCEDGTSVFSEGALCRFVQASSHLRSLNRVRLDMSLQDMDVLMA